MPGPFQLLIILVIVLVLFGGGRLAGLGRSLGTAIADLKQSITHKDDEKDSKEPRP